MKKEIKACLLDFDGTLVTADILDLLCGLVGKEEESREIDAEFHRGEIGGLESLIKRINMISGITKSQIVNLLKKNDFLMPGAKELMKFLKENNILTIMASGNILPVREYYQEILGIDYTVGSNPKIERETLCGIEESSYSSRTYKVDGIKKILEPLNIQKENIIAIGDSPADKGIFEMSGYKIAINPKGDIAQFADAVIKDDLSRAIDLIKNR